jgi:predicted permease
MEAFSEDFRHACRALRRRPVFTATAVLTLALGIGANTAIFSVVNAVVLEPVSVAEPNTLVQIVNTVNGQPNDTGASVEVFSYWREQASDVVEDIAAYGGVAVNYARDGGRPERVAASQVSAAYFRAFRARLALGRSFTADEDLTAAAPIAIISHGFWTQRLGGDPGVIGKTLSLNGVMHTVVGVTAPEFDTRDLGGSDLWLPLDPGTVGSFLSVAARLKPGISLAQANARLQVLAEALRARVPAMRADVGFGAVLFKDAVIATGSGSLFRNDPRGMLWLFSGAVALVLLIACANVASLMRAHAAARERELAVRSALGAGRWRLARQLLTESAIVAGFGGLVGLLVGVLGVRALLAIDSAGLPRLGSDAAALTMDWRVVAFTVVVSAVTVVISGLLPALAASRGDPNDAIKYTSGTRATGKNGARSAVVVAQIGLAIVLLVGTALLIKTMVALNAIDPGFNVDNVIVLRTPLPEERFHTSAAMGTLSSRTLERIRGVPGVEAAAASCCVPLQGSWGTTFKIIGRDDAGRPFSGGGDVTIATGEYFAVFENPVVRGRVFDERDGAGAPPVLVINRALADRWWPDGQEPLGQMIRIDGSGEPPREVVGIVENERKARLEQVRPILYVPLPQISDDWLKSTLETDPLAWVVRAGDDPLRLAAAIRNEIEESTSAPVTSAVAMTDILAASISRQRANAVLMTVFGGVALLLTAIGVYGLVAYSVQQRTHEIGIRMALGARRHGILGMVVRQGAVLSAAGTALGLAGAYFLVTLLASLLYGVEPRDVAVFVGVPVMLAVVVLGAVLIPAFKASRLDPVQALRAE